MKRAKRILRLCLPVCLIIGLILVISYDSPYRYLRGCYHSNSEQLSRIAAIFKGFYEPGLTHAKYELTDETLTLSASRNVKQSAEPELKTLLSSLQEQYQKDSPYPVFSIVSAEYDSKGSMSLSLTVRATHIKGRSSTEGRDVLYSTLMYLEDGFDRETSSSYHNSGKHLTGCWYMQVAAGYSG